MNGVDALLLVWLAAADITLLICLRRRHNRHMRLERMYRSLHLALGQDSGAIHL